MKTLATKSILFMGPTGSGKGTQAKLLSEVTGYTIFSSGDRFREIRKQESKLGHKAKDWYDQGLLMPHWFASFVFEEKLLYAPDDQGVIFEGTARTLAEAQLFDEISAWLGRDYLAICLNVNEPEAMRRQLKRALVEHRPDSDTPEKIKVRFTEFDKHTAPAIEHFRSLGKVLDLDGERPIEVIHQDILTQLGL